MGRLGAEVGVGRVTSTAPGSPAATLVVDPEHFEGTEVTIEGDAYRHLFRARRLARGAQLRVVDGEGKARLAVVESIDRRTARLVLGEPTASNEPTYSLDLWVAALKPERASWLVEKATELGVSAIRFFNSERTPRRYGNANLDRWRRIATSAVEQCHRARVPELEGVVPWDAMVERLAGAEVDDLLVLDASGQPASELPAPGGTGIVVVGPEGGFTREEIDALRAVGAQAMALGKRVLRVETAAVVAVARRVLG